MMNLHYGDARNKNKSPGQNKLNKFTSNTYASSSINSISTFPTITSSLNSNNPCRIPRENIVTCVCLSRLSQLPQKHAYVRLNTAHVNSTYVNTYARLRTFSYESNDARLRMIYSVIHAYRYCVLL